MVVDFFSGDWKLCDADPDRETRDADRADRLVGSEAVVGAGETCSFVVFLYAAARRGREEDDGVVSATGGVRDVVCGESIAEDMTSASESASASWPGREVL
jgi:hypothetical protein